MRRGRSTHLRGHMPRMERSPGGRLAVGEVSVEHVTCASSGRKEGQGWVGFQVATAQRSAGVSLPLRRWRGRHRLIAQAAGERGHLAARRASPGWLSVREHTALIANARFLCQKEALFILAKESSIGMPNGVAQPHPIRYFRIRWCG